MLDDVLGIVGQATDAELLEPALALRDEEMAAERVEVVHAHAGPMGQHLGPAAAPRARDGRDHDLEVFGVVRVREHEEPVTVLVVDVVLDRPAVLTPLLPFASAVVASFGTSDEALLDALTGTIPPRGRLPFDLPRSMEQVRAHPEDVPGYGDPLLPFGHGLTL